LKGYRRKWDEKNLMFEDIPLHDWCSDYADAFGYLCVVAQPDITRAAANKAMGTGMGAGYQAMVEFNLANLFADNEARMNKTKRIS
jgi:hypothetical protein